ncbi:hypothetical protein H5410_017170 [Solanum commersonii]|uniref:Uncharacterized protein n=1 Tax=Solanum commersonii TaxID=4109 RepID=A0A9J5ZZA3_SOLCO|nr:hypothetical protein H5410_017170 [Solanum commersonii]
MEGPENNGFSASMCSTRGKHQACNEGCLLSIKKIIQVKMNRSGLWTSLTVHANTDTKIGIPLVRVTTGFLARFRQRNGKSYKKIRSGEYNNSPRRINQNS